MILGVGENRENVSSHWIPFLLVKCGSQIPSPKIILSFQVNLVNNVPSGSNPKCEKAPFKGLRGRKGRVYNPGFSVLNEFYSCFGDSY